MVIAGEYIELVLAGIGGNGPHGLHQLYHANNYLHVLFLWIWFWLFRKVEPVAIVFHGSGDRIGAGGVLCFLVAVLQNGPAGVGMAMSCL